MFPEELTLAELAEEILILGLKFSSWSSEEASTKQQSSLRALKLFLEQAKDAHHSPAAVEMAHFALAAYLDEKCGEKEKLYLTQSLHGEIAAGEKFFQHLEELECGGPMHSARQVFLLCLVFGFEGGYKECDGELADEALLREAEELWDRRTAKTVPRPQTALNTCEETIPSPR